MYDLSIPLYTLCNMWCHFIFCLRLVSSSLWHLGENIKSYITPCKWHSVWHSFSCPCHFLTSVGCFQFQWPLWAEKKCWFVLLLSELETYCPPHQKRAFRIPSPHTSFVPSAFIASHSAGCSCRQLNQSSFWSFMSPSTDDSYLSSFVPGLWVSSWWLLTREIKQPCLWV